MKNYTERQKWFIDRIGKRIYGLHTCPCSLCQHFNKNGEVIVDLEDALITEQYDMDCHYQYQDTPHTHPPHPEK